MKSVFEKCFPDLFEAINRGDSPLKYDGKTRRFSISVIIDNDGRVSNSSDTIYYCPFSGTKLPTELSDEWYDEIESLGLDPWEDEISGNLSTEQWWIDKFGNYSIIVSDKG